MGLDETREGRGAQADDTENLYAIVEVVDILTKIQEATNEMANEGDLIIQADNLVMVHAVEVSLFIFTGVEAVFEGVAVAWRGAALARGGRVGHGDLEFQI